MGIRYYAYAFDADRTEQALADPFTVIGSDPLADAWGLEPGFTMGVMGERPSLPERDFVYLDKAWRHLQRITWPGNLTRPRPAYRMFEGQVSWSGMGHEPWVRVLTPDEVLRIAPDLERINEQEVEENLDDPWKELRDKGEEVAYAVEHLHRAKAFVQLVAAERRGFAYLIG